MKFKINALPASVSADFQVLFVVCAELRFKARYQMLLTLQILRTWHLSNRYAVECLCMYECDKTCVLSCVLGMRVTPKL